MSPSGVGVTRLARTDWLVMILVSFPHIFFGPFVAGDVSSALAYSLFLGGVLFLLTGFVGVIIDRVRGFFSAPSRPLDQNTFERLQEALNSQGLHPVSLVLTRMHFVPSDHTMGAHVRGVFIPYVVISAGMLIGLLRKDPRAHAILCHEIAHIEHYDRLLPGFIGLALFTIIVNPIRYLYDVITYGESTVFLEFLFVAAWQLLVFVPLVSVISKYREYYADARALAMTIDRESYLLLIDRDAKNPSGGFQLFHPSLTQRLSEAHAGYPVLRRGLLWKVYLPLHALTALVQWFTLDGFLSEYAQAAFFVSLVCLVLQFFRGWILRSGSSTALNTPEMRTETFEVPAPLSSTVIESTPQKEGGGVFPYIFLVVGFFVAVAVADIFNLGTNGQAIGAGIVYVIFRSMKD